MSFFISGPILRAESIDFEKLSNEIFNSSIYARGIRFSSCKIFFKTSTNLKSIL